MCLDTANIMWAPVCASTHPQVGHKPLIRSSAPRRVPRPEPLSAVYSWTAAVSTPKPHTAFVLLGLYAVVSTAVLCRELMYSDCNFFYFRPARWMYVSSSLLVLLSLLVWVEIPQAAIGIPRNSALVLSSAVAVAYVGLCSFVTPGLLIPDQASWLDTGAADVVLVWALCFAICLEEFTCYPPAVAIAVLSASRITGIPEAYNSLPSSVALPYSIAATAEAAAPFVLVCTAVNLGVSAATPRSLGLLCFVLGLLNVIKNETCIALSCVASS